MKENSLDEISYVFTSDKFGVNIFKNVSFMQNLTSQKHRLLQVIQLFKTEIASNTMEYVPDALNKLNKLIYLTPMFHPRSFLTFSKCIEMYGVTLA